MNDNDDDGTHSHPVSDRCFASGYPGPDLSLTTDVPTPPRALYMLLREIRPAGVHGNAMDRGSWIIGLSTVREK